MRRSASTFGFLWLIGACAAASNGPSILVKVVDEHWNELLEFSRKARERYQ